MLLALLSACLIDKPSPNLGTCAEYPSGVYDYGQIGIGDCLAGPMQLEFLSNAAGETYLAVLNANPYALFKSGSIMTFPWDELELSTPHNFIDDLTVSTLELPSFAAQMHLTNSGHAMVTVRYSEDARSRVNNDKIYYVDLNDPDAPVAAKLGPNADGTLTVESDPVDIDLDQATGLAFVANRTSHSISIIDTTKAPMAIVPPWPFESLAKSIFEDDNGNGSVASFADLGKLSAEDLLDPTEEVAPLRDDVWSLSWIEGEWRLWLPESEFGSWNRHDTIGDGTYRPSFGPALESEDTAFEVIENPSISNGSALFSNNGDIYQAQWSSVAEQWQFNSVPLLNTLEQLNSPSILYSYEREPTIVVSAVDSDNNWSIKMASVDSAGNYQLEQTLLRADELAVERISEPYAVFDTQAQMALIYFSVFDGQTWSIQHIWKEDSALDSDGWNIAEPISISGLNQENIGAAVVSVESDRYRMWHALQTEDGEERWQIAAAESADGVEWYSLDVAIWSDIEHSSPPRAALQSQPSSTFRLSGEQAQFLAIVTPAVNYSATQYGWQATPLAGQWIDTDSFRSYSAGGVQLDDVNETTDETWLTVTDSAGMQRIGYTLGVNSAAVRSAIELEETSIVFEPEGQETGLSHPVFFTDGSNRFLLFTVHQGEQSSIHYALEIEGNWVRKGQLLGATDDWSSVAVVSNDVLITDTGQDLYFSGSNGSTWRGGVVSLKVNEEELSTEVMVQQPVLELGRAGNWDDSGVRDLNVRQLEDGTVHCLYAGFDGNTWRIGAALSDGERFTQLDSEILASSGLFYSDSVQRPVFTSSGLTTSIWYSGIENGQSRVGMATNISNSLKSWRPVYKTPDLGETLYFETHRGDEERISIPLDTVTEDLSLSGVGLTELTVDSQRGVLYATSKLLPYITVIDIRDDSGNGFVDRNTFDIEAVIGLTTASGAVGFRDVLPHPTENWLFALNDAPESVFIIDLDNLVDDEYPDLIAEAQIGSLPAPMGAEVDKGVRTRMSIGPGKMALSQDGKTLYVSNFNANSISVYDLTLGPYGQEIAEIMTDGENPYALTLSPSGAHLVVANYTGDVDNEVSSSTLTIFDVDPDSETYLQRLTQVVNQ